VSTLLTRAAFRKTSVTNARMSAAGERRGAAALVSDVLQSSGHKLRPADQEFFRDRFGHDFSQVRIHADARAAESALALNALAYTVGRDVAFAAGRYAPESPAGNMLLGHELTHVVQQRFGDARVARERPLEVFANDAPSEREAADLARSLGSSAPANSARAAAGRAANAPMPSLAQRTVLHIARQSGDGKQPQANPPAKAPPPAKASPPAKAPPPPKPSFDEIVQEMGPGLGGPFADYAAFAGSMVSGKFLGHDIARGVRPEFLAKLDQAKTAIDAQYTKSGNKPPAGYGINGVGGFRSKAGPHGWGLAIDIDGGINPYVMHEAGEGKLDTRLVPVYHRIAGFMLNSPIGNEQSIIPKIITSGASMTGAAKQTREARLGEYYDRLALESKAMQDYFALMKSADPTAIATFLAGPWKTTHPAQTPPSVDDVRLAMWEDYAALGGQIPKGGPPGVTGFKAPDNSAVDPPFAPRGQTQQDPAGGFLTIPREVAIGLGQTLTRWGAIDFGGESGDVMHFDDMNGLGLEASKATAAAQAKKTAAPAAKPAAPAADAVHP
jgi:hypothetical protein